MRFVIDGTTVSAIGGRGVQVVRTTTPKGYQRPEKRTAQLGTAVTGMQARQLKRGSLVGGQRVIGMRRGMASVPGYAGSFPTVSVQLEDLSWTAPMFLNQVVPGTRPVTDLPAGPVGAGRGMRANRTGRRDGESAGDRHSRLIDSIQYA
jgi:hypothetical protein